MNLDKLLRDNPRNCSRGAPMGASDWRGDPNYAYKFFLQRLTMTDGAYTLDGTYWGGPANLYLAYCPAHDATDGVGAEDDVRMFVRADSRDEAKALVIEEYPNAKFYR